MYTAGLKRSSDYIIIENNLNHVTDNPLNLDRLGLTLSEVTESLSRIKV